MIRGPRNIADYRDDAHNYVDPLPACDLASAYDGAPWTSVTTILGDAYPAFLDAWKLGLAADHAIANAPAIVQGHMEGDLTAVKADIVRAPDAHRDAAAARGTDVHRLLETMLDGGQLTMYDETSPAWPYVEQIRRVAADMAAAGVTLAGSEIVVVHRVDGWAGTFDAVWRTADGRNLLVDYKSRKETKAATRYPKEAAQLGGYASGEYWIVDSDDGPHRIEPLPIAGGLIVSIAPDDTRYYTVDIAHARRSWIGALLWRTTKAQTVEAFAKPDKDLAKIGGGGEPAHGVADENPAAAPLLPRTSTRHFPPTLPAWVPPPEGRRHDYARTRERLEERTAALGLNTLAISIVSGWVSEGDRSGRPWRIEADTATARRLAIYGAAMRLAAWDGLTDDNAATLVGYVLGEELQPSMTIGMALGSLTAEQARTLSGLADLLLDGGDLETLTAA